MTREERITHIVELMASGAWQGTTTAKALAADWGLAVNNVRELAQHAGQRMRGAQEAMGAQALIQERLARLDAIEREAMAFKLEVMVGKGEDAHVVSLPRPDFRVALEAVKEGIKVLGGGVQGAVGKGASGRSNAGGDEAPLPRAELIRRTREALAQLEAEEQTEGKGMH